jgi:hypothetical protein
MQIRCAHGRARGPPCLVQRWKQYGNQQSDDTDDHQQLDKRKACRASSVSWLIHS